MQRARLGLMVRLETSRVSSRGFPSGKARIVTGTTISTPARRGWVRPMGGTWPRRRRVGRRDRYDRSASAARRVPMLFGIRGQRH